MKVRLLPGDCRDVLPTLPDNSARCGASWVQGVAIERGPHPLPRGPGGRQTLPGAKLGPHSMFNNGLLLVSTTTGWSPSSKCCAGVAPCTVLDLFGGAGTTALVASRTQRDAISIELKPEYIEIAQRRIIADAPLFVDVDGGVA